MTIAKIIVCNTCDESGLIWNFDQYYRTYTLKVCNCGKAEQYKQLWSQQSSKLTSFY